ncbi:Glycosyltransferase involved in cell wall bisynthesis [Candidatus Electronema halotolerans]
MKIGFLLGSPRINGGTYVIYEHASRLKRKGHRVVLITKQEVATAEHAWHSSASELEWLILEQAKNESFDMLLATWWQSPFLLHQLEAVHYAYFIQSIETRFFEPPGPADFSTADNPLWQNLCEKTYSYKLPMITEACWIQEYLYKNWNSWPHLVRNGIRKDIYTAEGKTVAPRSQGHFRVLVEGPVHVSYKNVPAALRLARQAGADEIWLLTSSDMQEHPDADHVFSQVPIHETPAIYRSCDLLLKLSYVEGMFGPPLEIFHCGGTALVYDVTGHDEYIVHDQNAYVVPKDDEEQVVCLLRHLKSNPAELDRLKKGAAATAAAWPDWDVCSEQFEQALLAIAAERPTSRDYLRQHTEALHSLLDPLSKAKAQALFAEREKAAQAGAVTCRDNFVQLYWDGAGEFTVKKSKWRHYRTEESATVSFEIRAEETPLWLRLDPSVQLGIIAVEWIRVRNKTRDRKIMAFRKADEFSQLFLTGDLTWLFRDRKNIFLSCGPDPMFVLPQLSRDCLSIGDYLEIAIKLKESGVQQFFAEQQSQGNCQEKNSSDNVLRLYWDSSGKFTAEQSQQHLYPPGESTTVSFTLPVKEMPLWLRLDPSRRTGIIELHHLTVRNVTRNQKIMTFRQPDDFKTLFLTGDLTWPAPARRNILLAGGANSICILPQLQENDAAPGDLLEVTVCLKESSLPQFLAGHQISLADRTSSRWQRLFQCLRGQLCSPQ